MSTRYIKRPCEETEQQAVIQWARLSSGRFPELALLHHIPNGGSRNVREGAKLKRMGVLAGVPDLHLPAARGGYHSLYIEMKFGDGRISREQKEFMNLARRYGNCCRICYSAEEAIQTIKDYLNNRIEQ
jgi:hypothetical protein